jgi:hypothetical protein
MFDPAKQVEALQSTRWWVAISIAATAAIFIFVPFLAALLSPLLLLIAWLAMALFGLLLVFQPVNAVISLYRDKGGEESKTTMPPPKPKRYHMSQ